MAASVGLTPPVTPRKQRIHAQRQQFYAVHRLNRLGGLATHCGRWPRGASNALEVLSRIPREPPEFTWFIVTIPVILRKATEGLVLRHRNRSNGLTDLWVHVRAM